MIPKIIHYIWLSDDIMPKAQQMIVADWKRLLPEFNVRRWTAADYGRINNKPKYVEDAYAQKKWAFVSDWMRAYILYTQGGFYLDTDMQIINPDLLRHATQYRCVTATETGGTYAYPYPAYNSPDVSIQAAFLGAEKGHAIMRSIDMVYYQMRFDFKGTNTLIAPEIYASIFANYGYRYANVEQDMEYGTHVYTSGQVIPHPCHMPKDTSGVSLIHQCAHGWVEQPWGVTPETVRHYALMNEDKWIIQSFWTKPMREADIPYHVELAKLSLYYAHRSGYKVRMYCDNAAIPYLRPLGYDSLVNTLEQMPANIPTSLFAASKAYAIAAEIDRGARHIVHTDYDVFIKKPLLDEFFYDNSIDCILQCREDYGCFAETYDSIAMTLHCIGYPLTMDPDHKGISNTGVIGFNNLYLASDYIHNYKAALAYLCDGRFNRVCRQYGLDMRLDFVLEQVTIDYMIASGDYTVRYLLPGGKSASRCAELIGYQHLQGPKKYDKETRENVGKLIRKFGI